MSMSEFNKMMTHEIQLIKRTKNESGDFSNISSTTYPAFVQYGNHLIEKENGEIFKAIAIVFLNDSIVIDISYPYWFINQIKPYVRSNMEVLKIDPIDHPLRAGKTHHYEIFVR
jgi:hypothetical protein